MPEFQLEILTPRPFFAEFPYYVWGRVNYDSDGDCKAPLDRDWTYMELTNRETDEHLDIYSKGSAWTIAGDEPAAARAAYFLKCRCNGDWIAESIIPNLDDWDHEQAASRAESVAAVFENELLAPFAKDHMFWGSWKWIGWFGTHFTWVGRWIMDSLVHNVPRAVNLCIDWLREGPAGKSQSVALRYALTRLTGVSFETDQEWIRWYDDAGGKEQYPEPDMNAWFADLKTIHGA